MHIFQIITGTVTYAIKGRDLLRRKGYKANMEKTKSQSSNGCGYSIIVSGDIAEIEKILKDAGIKILEIIAR